MQSMRSDDHESPWNTFEPGELLLEDIVWSKSCSFLDSVVCLAMAAAAYWMQQEDCSSYHKGHAFGGQHASETMGLFDLLSESIEMLMCRSCESPAR